MPSPQFQGAPRSKSKSRGRRRVSRRGLIALTSLGLAGLLAGLLSGCAASGSAAATGSNSAATVSYAQMAGNWQFGSSASAAARLSSLGGSLSVGGSAVSGNLHPLAVAAGQCLDATTTIPVAGSVDSAGKLTLTSSVAGGTLTIAGTVSDDRKSLTAATYTVTGGSCGFAAAQTVAAREAGSTVTAREPVSTVTAQQYQPVSGTYLGTLTDSDGMQFTLSTTITETSQPDVNGVYHIQGTASSPGNACIPTAVNATASTVTGSAVLTTYSDPTTGTTIDATGTSTPDGSKLTVTNWNLVSNCGSDSGTGTLTRQ